ncbi:MAG TPA: cellulase family glycosylhydrolase [Thermoleophilia bacterium]|nr:cellulase family glycosylhydrolase [Thermoleophilia bacterium]
MREVGRLLGASVVRTGIAWQDVEPLPGIYNETYLSQVSATIDAARAEGMSVVVTVWAVPRWASDSSFWNRPPGGYPAGEYRHFYPIRTDCLDDYRLFAENLSRRLAGRVMAYECWNEPNLWTFLYPQRTASDSAFAAHRYVDMVRAFSAGIRSGDPTAKVVAGSTAPSGSNNAYSTSPQRFARIVQKASVGDSFDVYSHHPYMTGGVKNVAPEQPPRDPSTAVALGNISTLLEIFPDKPFYLTEYGYNTSYNYAFGFSVTHAHQADYLRRAYVFARRYPQIKLLVWYTLHDWSPTDRADDPRGMYLGLRNVRGARKPAWYAFAGGNALTLSAPFNLEPGSPLLLRGRLTCAAVGGLEGKVLVVQRYRRDTGWRTVAKVTTGDDGYCRLRLWPQRSASYRLSWPGVVRSPLRTVLVR